MSSLPEPTVIFPSLYIRTDLDAEVIVLNNVYGWARGVRDIRTGTYRDTGWNPGKVNVWAGGTSTVPNMPPPAAAEVPVVGQAGSPVSTISLVGLKHSNPDEVDHVPPRFYTRRESGYLFALLPVIISQPAPPPLVESVIFTVNTATDVCTTVSFATHKFLPGDKVAITSTTTRPAPVTATDVYDVIIVNAAEFMLRGPAGDIVNFTNAGTGTHTAVVVEAVPRLPPNEQGVFFVPDAWNPRINSVDPRV
jgi:hypothetical protein